MQKMDNGRIFHIKIYKKRPFSRGFQHLFLYIKPLPGSNIYLLNFVSGFSFYRHSILNGCDCMGLTDFYGFLCTFFIIVIINTFALACNPFCLTSASQSSGNNLNLPVVVLQTAEDVPTETAWSKNFL